MPSFKISLPQNWVLPLSIAFFSILLILVYTPMLQFSEGQIIYPLDDAYLRMATAKNLATHGIWGLNQHEFASTSSSILYPLVLAVCFIILGPHAVIPLLINLVAAIGFISTLQRWLQKQGLQPLHQLLILGTCIYLAPLHILVIDGMEHVIQIWLSWLFISTFSAWMSRNKSEAGKYSALPWSLYLYGALITGIRYEGLFIVLVAVIILSLRRKWFTAGLLSLGAFLLPMMFGMYSLANGSYFISSSILIRAFPLPLDGERIGNFFKDGIIDKLFYFYPTRGALAGNRLLIVLPLVCLSYFADLQGKKLLKYILYFVLAITLMHLALVNVMFYYRYEAYLVACGLIVPAVLCVQQGIPLLKTRGCLGRITTAWVMIYLLFPFFSRSWAAYENAGYEFLHEYQNNYQAARFLQGYYDNATVVMDELGMASFMSSGRKLDAMTGIAYKEVTQTRIDGFTRVEYMNYLLKKENPVIALIAENKYHPLLRQGWVKVATWYTRYRTPEGGTDLNIYAVNPVAASTLRANLKTFQQTMPQGIKVEYF